MKSFGIGTAMRERASHGENEFPHRRRTGCGQMPCYAAHRDVRTNGMRAVMEKVRVSAIMPVFNARPFLEQAIESVLAQDHRDFELLIGDDASTDGSQEVLERYRNHGRVRVFTNQRNEGAAATRNSLIRLAAGDYITPCDADDLMVATNMTTLSRFLDDHAEVGAVYGDILELLTDAEGNLIDAPRVVGQDCRKTWDLVQNSVNHGGSMIRRSALLAAGGYDESVRTVDDWSMWLRLAEVSEIRYLEGAVLYIWRRHPSG